jgi:hypothetical protein
MLTTSQLLTLTHNFAPGVVKRAVNPKSRVVLQDSMFSPTGLGKKYRYLYLKTGLRNDSSTGLYHACVIRIDGSESDPDQYLLRQDSKLWVHCRCPFFTYYLEYALAQKKATSIWDSDGTAGKRIRNPKMVPYLCKHLYASILSTLLIEKNKSVYKPGIKTGIKYGELEPSRTAQGLRQK